MTIGKYILVNGEVTRERGLLKWGRWMEDHRFKECRIAHTVLDEVTVSTIFIGLDHDFSGKGPPRVFETMIFGGGYETDCWRTCTMKEAKATHRKAVVMVRKSQAERKSFSE